MISCRRFIASGKSCNSIGEKNFGSLSTTRSCRPARLRFEPQFGKCDMDTSSLGPPELKVAPNRLLRRLETLRERLKRTITRTAGHTSFRDRASGWRQFLTWTRLNRFTCPCLIRRPNALYRSRQRLIETGSSSSPAPSQARQRCIEKCSAAPHAMDDSTASAKSARRRLVDCRVHHSAHGALTKSTLPKFSKGESYAPEYRYAYFTGWLHQSAEPERPLFPCSNWSCCREVEPGRREGKKSRDRNKGFPDWRTFP